MVSFITEGVFERYPRFTVVLVEGGVAWLAPLIWRLTDHWRSMRSEVPWMDKPPLHYLHRNVRLTTQPMENPDDPAHLAALLRNIDADQVLMYSSDYPHFDFDSPTVIARRLPADMHHRVFYANAACLYHLPPPRRRRLPLTAQIVSSQQPLVALLDLSAGMGRVDLAARTVDKLSVPEVLMQGQVVRVQETRAAHLGKGDDVQIIGPAYAFIL